MVQGETQRSPEVGPDRSGDTSSTDMSPSAVEGMLLMALEKLYKEDRELDVQMGLLRVVLQVLQRHGSPLPPSPSPLGPPLPLYHCAQVVMPLMSSCCTCQSLFCPVLICCNG